MQVTDQELIEEISRRIEQKEASIKYIEYMTRKLLKLNEKYDNSKKELNKYEIAARYNVMLV